MSDIESGALGFDPDGVRAWMSSLLVTHEGRLEFRRVGAGASNLTIEVRDETGQRWILRRPPLGALLASAHDVEREARILLALGPTSVPVPRVLGMCRDERASSAPMLLMEHVDGVVIDSVPVAQSLSLTVRGTVSMGMVETLGRIHDVDLEVAGLSTLASHKPYAERQLRRWAHQWESVRTRELRGLDELTDLLTSSIPAQSETVLVHGDLHLANVICDDESGEVRAVLDWELTTLGDPVADLGTLLAYWPQAGDPPTTLFPASSIPGFATRDALLDSYATRTGRDVSSVPFWHALGLWKVAIISEGVLRRALDEPLNASTVRQEAVVVDELVDRAFAALAG